MAEALKATFFALRRRERGGVLLGATVCYLLFAAALYAGFIAAGMAILGVDFAGLASLGAAPETSSPAANPFKFLWLLPLAFLGVFAFCVLNAAFEAACLRWMVRGEVTGLFGLALDQDTWRVYGIYWVWALAYVLAVIGWGIISALLGAVFPGNQVALLATLALYVCSVLLHVVLLAPAAATSIAARRFVFFDAASVSEDRVAPLFGSFVVLLAGQWLLTSALTMGWLLWAIGPALLNGFAQVADYQSALTAYNANLQAALQAPGSMPVYWALTAANFVITIFFTVLIYGVNARAAALALDEGRLSVEQADG